MKSLKPVAVLSAAAASARRANGVLAVGVEEALAVIMAALRPAIIDAVEVARHDRDRERGQDDQREHRAADMPAINAEGRARTCDNGCEGIGPRMWASTIDPILGGRGIITG